MGFSEAVRRGLRDRYAAFSGRAGRAEFWWFLLFSVLAAAGATVAMAVALIAVAAAGASFSVQSGFRLVLPGLLVLVLLGLAVPLAAVTVRRLHDMGMTGWVLLPLPVAGVAAAGGLVPQTVALAVVGAVLGTCARRGRPGGNRHGADPRASAVAEVFR